MTENSRYHGLDGRRTYEILSATVLIFVAALWTWRLWKALHSQFYFDDAYMFLRYAENVKRGLGVSWNLDGVPTYGQTAPLWGLVVLLMSYLPLPASAMLALSSWLCSIGALCVMAWAVAANSQSRVMRSTWRVLPMVALPLALAEVFYYQAITGMETMLAALLNGAFVGLAIRWQRGASSSELVGVVGLLLFLTRPEAAIVVVLLPLLMFFLKPGTSLRGLIAVLGVFTIGVLFDLLASKLYFHTALPLSFYMKSAHGYEGYRVSWQPELSFLMFLSACQVYLVALVVFIRRSNWRLLICCLLPALAVSAYLQTVVQIMGLAARYYVPYLPLLVVPALLTLDSYLDSGAIKYPLTLRVSKSRIAGVAAVLIFFLGMRSQRVMAAARMVEPVRYQYGPVELRTVAKVPLPEMNWTDAIRSVTDLLVKPLPPGSTVAASEVGYLGQQALQVNVIDLAGLNDTQIAMNGFEMNALLDRKPDLIWMPHVDYTYQRGLMLSDPALLMQYDLYAGAANFGLAIRKQTPNRDLIERQMKLFWDKNYPGYSMGDYVVHSATWSLQKHRVAAGKYLAPNN